MTREEMLSDLAYARTLAEEGRQAPLIGGAYPVYFGVLLMVCYGAQYAVLSGAVDLPGQAIGWIWIGFGAMAAIGSFVLNQRVRDLPGGAAISNRVDRAVWQGVVAAIFVVVVGTILRGVMQNDYTAPNAIVASGFGFYGVAIYATATLSGEHWLRGFALLSWIVSGVIWFFLGEPWVYLIAAIASVAVLIVPGIIMIQRQPRTLV